MAGKRVATVTGVEGAEAIATAGGQGVLACTRLVAKAAAEGEATAIEASIAEVVAADVLLCLAVPYEVVEYATSSLRSDVESVADEGCASFAESVAEACTAWASVAEDAAAEAPPVSSGVVEACPASAAGPAAAACTVAAEGPPAATAEAHTTVAAEVSSSEAGTSAGPRDHTGAARAGRSRLAAAKASGIVEGPSFGAWVDISIELSVSYQHLHDYLSWCLSHQFSFGEQALAGTSWDTPASSMAADSAAI